VTTNLTNGMEPVAEQDLRFGDPGAPPTPWADVLDVLEAAELFWISTVRGDGRPHVTPLRAVWDDGQLHFCTGPERARSRRPDTGSTEPRPPCDRWIRSLPESQAPAMPSQRPGLRSPTSRRSSPP
jgi:Pyridoxamine 5'-phosphate oxidase